MDKDQCHVTSHKEMHMIKASAITCHMEFCSIELATRRA